MPGEGYSQNPLKRESGGKETIPGLARVGVLVGEQAFSESKMQLTTHPTAAWVREIKAHAPKLDLHLHVVIVADGSEFKRAFASFKGRRTQAIVLYGRSLMAASVKTVAALP